MEEGSQKREARRGKPEWLLHRGGAVVDSPHGGNGRQMYLFDIGAIVG
jgi:hypothetical protein